MIDFAHKTFQFPPTTGREQSMSLPVVFETNVSRAQAMLSGFAMEFVTSEHPLHQEEINLHTTIDRNTVLITVTFRLRDDSGFYDDTYSGRADVSLIVEREDEDGATLQSGDQVALRAYNGQLVCAENGGGREVVANRNAIGVWEKFTITKA